MKRFQTFMEEVKSAKVESDAREQRSKEFTQTSKEKAQKRRDVAHEKISHQKKKIRSQIKKRLRDRQIARERAAVTAHNTKKSIKGVAKAGRSVVKYVKQKMSK